MLLSDDHAGTGSLPLEAGAIPKYTADGTIFRGIAGGEKDLDAVAGPFCRRGVKTRRTQEQVALRFEFEEKHRVAGSGRSGDEQQVGIARIRTDDIGRRDLNTAPKDFVEVG